MPESQPPTVGEFPPTLTLSTQAESPAAPTPGELPDVQGYQIVRLIGRGGMGVVYEARDLSLQRTVALKMILVGQHASDRDRARFRSEAEAVARLQHTGIVQIYEIGESSTGPFLALEYVGGGSLAEKLDGKPWLAAHAARLVEQVAEAVEAAHQVGIVHRDLKPANILLPGIGYRLSAIEQNKDTAVQSNGTQPTAQLATSDSRHPTPDTRYPKITDFGLAKRIDSGQGQTASGAILGTPSYMAPEQAEGKSQQIGPGTDVYALGAILYELLTGRPPFLAETPFDTIMQVCRQEPVPPARLNPKVPADLETICLKCLRKEPERRYPSSAALVDDLRRYQDGRPIQARPVGPLERGWRWCRRNPAVACLLAAVATTLIAGTVVASYFAIQARDRYRDAQARTAEAKKSEANAKKSADEAIEAKKQAERSLYAARLGLLQNALRDNRLIYLRQFLKETEPVDGEEDQRGWEWYFVDRQTRMTQHAYSLKAPSGSTDVYGFALSPSSGRGAFLSWKTKDDADGEDLTVIELDTGKVVFTREVKTVAFELVALSGDGRVVAWCEQGAIHAVNLVNQKTILRHPVSDDGQIYSLALDGTGTKLAFSMPGSVQIVSIEDNKVKKVDPGAGMMVVALQLDWPGTNLFAARHIPGTHAGDTQMEVVQIDGKSGVVRPTIGPVRELSSTTFFALSGDGRVLFIPTGKRSVAAWSVPLQKQVGGVNGVPDRLASLAASPDGRRLAVGRVNGTITVHDVQDEAAAPVVLRAHHSPTMWLAFLGADQLCGIAEEGNVRIWSATRPEQARLANQFNYTTRSTVIPAFDARGKYLAQLAVASSGPASINNLEVIVWDTTTQRVRFRHSLGAYLRDLPAFGPSSGQVALSDDGKTLAVVLNRQEQVEALKSAAGLLPNLALRLGGGGRPSNVSKVLVDAGLRQLTQETEVVRLFDLTKLKEIGSMRLPEPAERLLINGDGKYVLANGNGWHLYDSAGKLLVGKDEKAKPHERDQSLAAFHPDGRRFVASRTTIQSHPVTSIELRSLGEPERGISVPLEPAEQSLVIRAFKFSPSGRYLAALGDALGALPTRTGESANRLILWRIADDGSAVRLWSAPFGVVTGGPLVSERLPIAFDETNGRLAVGAVQRDQVCEVVIRNLQTGAPIKKVSTQATSVQFVGFTADGKRLLVVNCTFVAETHSAELHVFDPISGQELLEMPLGNVITFQGSAFHFDGHCLRAAGWNDKTGEYRMLDGSPAK